MATTEHTPLLPEHQPLLRNDGDPESNTANAGTNNSRAAGFRKWFIKNGIVILAATIVAVAIVIFGYLVLKVKSSPKRATVCVTPACIHAASAILDSLSTDEKITPCDNFEEYVCGGWKDQHDLRADQRELFEMSLINERSSMILRHVLEGEYEAKSAHSSFSPAALDSSTRDLDKANFDKLKAAYDACLNEEAIAARGLEPVLDVLQSLKDIYSVGKGDKAVAGGPLPHLTEALVYLQELGLAGFVDFGVTADDKDPDTQVLVVDGPRRVGLRSKEEYKDEKVVEKYTTMINSMFRIVSEALGQANSDSLVAEDVVALEKKLSAITLNEDDANDPLVTYNPFTVEELKALTPSIQFGHLFSHFSPDYEVKRVIVSSPDYMKKVDGIIRETKRETVQAYLLWKIIYGFAGLVDKKAVDPVIQFKSWLQGTHSQPERWRSCVQVVDNELGWILGRFYIEKAFSEAAKQFGDRIIYDIRDQFVARLKELDWFDSKATDLAIQKVHNIDQKIGYPDKSPNITSPASLYEYYSAIEVSKTKFFENSMSVIRDEMRKNWSNLGKPTNRNEWGMTPPTVNAYYNPPGNEIVFPAGIMQFPIFSLDVPEYISYGAFASIAGHELSHAFDSTGRHYDIHGNLTDWWPQKTVDEFEKRAQCFVDQYSEFSVEGPDGKRVHVNGKLTLGENIADAGGVNAGFKAWKKRDAEKPNAVLPGVAEKFTKEQLFFVSYARAWCGKIRREAAIDRVRTDPHSPAFARVLGTMANAPEFLKAFNCPKKKPTCELW